MASSPQSQELPGSWTPGSLRHAARETAHVARAPRKGSLFPRANPSDPCSRVSPGDGGKASGTRSSCFLPPPRAEEGGREPSRLLGPPPGRLLLHSPPSSAPMPFPVHKVGHAWPYLVTGLDARERTVKGSAGRVGNTWIIANGSRHRSYNNIVVSTITVLHFHSGP